MIASRRPRRIIDTVAVTVFTLVVCFPLVSLLRQKDLAIAFFPVPGSISELSGYHKDLKGYFAASVNVRRAFAATHSRLKLAMNGPSRVGGVLVGKDGWLFLEWMTKGQDYRVQTPLSHDALVRSRAYFENAERECRIRGMRYLLVLVPSKQAIYPEFLPDAVHDRIGSDSKARHLARYLNAKSTTLDTLDLSTAMSDTKLRGDVFYRTDSHWNSLGAFSGGQAINGRLRDNFPQLPPASFADIFSVTNLVPGGNEAEIIGRRNQLQEEDVRIRYRDGSLVTLRTGGPVKLPLINVCKGGEIIETVSPTGQIDSAVIFHNSFGYALIEHLGRTFKSARWVWGPFSTEKLRDTNADVVIDLQTLEFYRRDGSLSKSH